MIECQERVAVAQVLLSFGCFCFLDKLRLVHEKVKAMFSNFTINAHPMAIMVSCQKQRWKAPFKTQGLSTFLKRQPQQKNMKTLDLGNKSLLK